MREDVIGSINFIPDNRIQIVLFDLVKAINSLEEEVERLNAMLSKTDELKQLYENRTASL